MMKVKDDLARRVRRLLFSRKKWKQRIVEKQNLIRFLRVKARDLEASRSFWKDRAMTAEDTVRRFSACAADSAVPTMTATCAVGER
jgi:hypothetical protein